MVVHRLPSGEIGGEIPPRTAGAQHVEDGVEDATQGMLAWSAAPRERREVALGALPFCVGQVAWIARAHATERSPLRHVPLQNTLSGILSWLGVPKAAPTGTAAAGSRSR